MKENALVDVLEMSYGLTDYQLRMLNDRNLEDGTCVYKMYHIQRSLHPELVCFAVHDRLAERLTFRWERENSVRDWLEERVYLLRYLEQQCYPAPRVFLACDGSTLVRHEDWNMLITTFLEDEAHLVSPDNLYLLASAVGRLHCLALPLSIGASWWNTSYSIPHALGELEACSPFIPVSYQAFYERCRGAFVTMQSALDRLPECIIHGDVRVPNGVRTSEREVVLIDWEGAGRGAALLDLGELLLKGQFDRYGAVPETVNADAVAAMVSGYTRWRSPEPIECELLLDALRFRIAWVGAWRLHKVQFEGWSPGVEKLLDYVERLYLLSEPTADLALKCFEQAGEPRP